MTELELPASDRDLFPALREFTYLDTATSGITSPLHADAAAAFFNEGKWRGAAGREVWQNKARDVRARLAAWLKVDADEIDFFSGTTASLNILCLSIDWKRGDRIVFADDEFPSIQMAWQWAVKAGAELKPIVIEGERTREQQLIDALGDDTRMLVVGHAHSVTGTRLDLDRVGAACREKGVIFVVDGIQAFGAVPPSMSHVDVYVSGLHKWMLSGFGIGVCMIRKHLRAELNPGFRGYLNLPSGASIRNYPMPPADRQMQFAHVNYLGVYTLDASLELLGSVIGWDIVHGRTADLVRRLSESLAELGLEVASPEGARAGIVSFTAPEPEATRLKLLRDNIHVAARGPYLRASPYFYNSNDDIDIFVEKIKLYCV
jgi:cysteine desulfurase / selenocysteine lyase